MPEELKGATIDDIIKMYCDLKKDFLLLKEENKRLSHELWIKNGSGYMIGYMIGL